MTYYTISINGQKAVDVGYRITAGRCYKRLENGIAQLEVVVDDPGTYNGNPNKWVDVSYIKTGSDVEKVINILAKLGFSGCPCLVTKDTASGCYVKSAELFCCII